MIDEYVHETDLRMGQRFNVRAIITRSLQTVAMPVTAGSRRESKGFSPVLFYNASRFRGEKFPLETHCHCRAPRCNFAKTPVRAVKFMPGLVTMLLKRARFLVIVQRSAAKMERRKFRRGEIPVAIETRGNFRGTDISATALIVNYLYPDSAFGFLILREI